MMKTRATAYQPQSDGMVERMNNTVCKYLAKVVSNHQQDRDQYLSFFPKAYRSTVNESTGQTLANALFGRRMLCDLEFECLAEEDVACENNAKELRRRMGQLHEVVRSQVLKLKIDILIRNKI
ncbi:uncharacterized protein [Diabrotica undecimpunctata]|uniref:uncharacterized protein n=1 Tax=Diabrotica undecimpunctata TaxID=50387 RepID=UPI003B63A34D